MKFLKWTALIACLATTGLAQAQNDVSFTVEVSSDSVLLGNNLLVRFTLENDGGENFQPPVFEGFDVISGPNVSTSFNMTNGQVSQSISYSFYLQPHDIGNYYIQPASIETGEGVLETEPVAVLVLPNPDGVIQQPSLQDEFSLRFDNFGFGFDNFNLDKFGFDNFRHLMPPAPKAEPDQPKPAKKKRKTYKL